MRKNLTEAAWMLDSRSSLLQLRCEPWLTKTQIAIVDRGIAALDRLVAEYEFGDRRGRVIAHHPTNPSANRKGSI
jgi:hypothetical protein